MANEGLAQTNFYWYPTIFLWGWTINQTLGTIWIRYLGIGIIHLCCDKWMWSLIYCSFGLEKQMKFWGYAWHLAFCINPLREVPTQSTNIPISFYS